MLQVVRSFDFDGEPFTAGSTRVAEDHPAVRGREDHFVQVPGSVPGDATRSFEDRMRDLVARGSIEPGDGQTPLPGDSSRPTRSSDRTPAGQARSAALRALDQSGLDGRSGDRIDDLIRRDATGSDSRYFAAVADPNYRSAFLRILGTSPQSAGAAAPNAEGEAVERVAGVLAERAALGVGDGATGGYAVPADLDPTINILNAGELSPLRDIARSVSITVNEWKGVGSQGVVAAFEAEGTQVADRTPTISQPVIPVEKAHSYTEFSIEIGQDWAGLGSELAKLFADAKAILEADKFVNGTGTNEPTGILYELLNNAGSGSGDPDPEVAAAWGPDAIYQVAEQLGPRHQPRASWIGSNAAANAIWRFTSDTEPPLFSPDRSLLLGRPWRDCSTVPSALTDAATPVIHGDFSQFAIVDRIGMSIELIPHVMGADRRPLGRRGLYCYWRVGSGCLNHDAFRHLTIAGGSGSGSGSGD